MRQFLIKEIFPFSLHFLAVGLPGCHNLCNPDVKVFDNDAQDISFNFHPPPQSIKARDFPRSRCKRCKMNQITFSHQQSWHTCVQKRLFNVWPAAHICSCFLVKSRESLGWKVHKAISKCGGLHLNAYICHSEGKNCSIKKTARHYTAMARIA